MLIVEETEEAVQQAMSARVVDDVKKGDLMPEKGKGLSNEDVNGDHDSEGAEDDADDAGGEYGTEYNYGEGYYGWDDGYEQEV